MKNPTGYVWTHHMGASGEPEWPRSREARDELASRLFGAGTVANMDFWMGLAIDSLRNPDPSPERRRDRVDPERDDSRRRVFASLSAEQRSHVEQLLFNTVRGTVFSMLLDLDQFSGGLADVVIRDSDTEAELASVGQGSILDMHDRLGGWLDEFSDFVDEWEPRGSRGRPTRA